MRQLGEKFTMPIDDIPDAVLERWIVKVQMLYSDQALRARGLKPLRHAT
jgi:hypothetical protein